MYGPHLFRSTIAKPNWEIVSTALLHTAQVSLFLRLWRLRQSTVEQRWWSGNRTKNLHLLGARDLHMIFCLNEEGRVSRRGWNCWSTVHFQRSRSGVSSNAAYYGFCIIVIWNHSHFIYSASLSWKIRLFACSIIWIGHILFEIIIPEYKISVCSKYFVSDQILSVPRNVQPLMLLLCYSMWMWWMAPAAVIRSSPWTRRPIVVSNVMLLAVSPLQQRFLVWS